MGQVLRGVVKWFNDAKGFGFIEHESGQDVFVHYSVIDQDGFKTLKDGEPVEYELREGDKGLNASRVSRVNAPKQDDSSASTGDSEELGIEKVAGENGASESGDSPSLHVEVESSPTEALQSQAASPTEIEPADSDLEKVVSE